MGQTTAAAAKERPILFSAPMIRAILAGAKTQTRRVMKPQPEHGACSCLNSSTGWAQADGQGGCKCSGSTLRCPYGVPGDRLWVRETHAVFSISDDRPEAGVGYRADHPYGGDLSKGDGGYNWRWFEDANPRDKVARMVDADHWRPSIFMPRWASRITLEVTDVRVQRVQEISEEDAIAEGVKPFEMTEADLANLQISDESPETKAFWKAMGPGKVPAKAEYEMLWREINGKRPGCTWSDNPFVWAINFRACEAPRG